MAGMIYARLGKKERHHKIVIKKLGDCPAPVVSDVGDHRGFDHRHARCGFGRAAIRDKGRKALLAANPDVAAADAARN